MKRLKYSIFLFCALCILCSLGGCKKEQQFQTDFPLEEKAVTAALEKVGLPGVISDSETESYKEGHIHYVVRSPEETYEGTGNSLFLADIGSVNYKGQRMLLTIFNQSVDSDQIEWESWKQQLALAALLYGGFKDEEAVYNTFLDKKLPEGETSFGWDAQLTEGYCRLSYSVDSHKTYDEDGFEVRKRSAALRVNIYESRELYEKLSPNG